MQLKTLLACGLALLLYGGAKADLILTLDPSVLNALPGETVTFTGNLFNDSAEEVFLNGVEFPQVDAGLSIDELPFFQNTPFSLAPGASLPQPVALFHVTVDGNLAFGEYGGLFSVLGGADSSAFDVLADAPFRVLVGPGGVVPEPGSLALLASMLTGGALALRRRKK